MVEFEFWWLLVIPFFFALGWLAARVDIKQIISESTDLPSAYFKGLHYLITNQYERAIEAFDSAIKINNDSLELHFALGALLRRTGQIDRAINLHINLLEKREITPSQQESVKAELAMDYFKAGLYDRSEEILIVLNKEKYYQFSLNTLLEIYVKEREWGKAVETATELEKVSGVSFRVSVSHYFCEVAVNHILNKKYILAKKSLSRALEESTNCTRANILLGDIYAEEKLYEEAIVYWKKIEFQQPEYLGLVAAKIINASQGLNKVNEGLSILARFFDIYKLKSLLNILYETVLANEGPKQAENIARKELIQRPSLSSLDQLFQAQTIGKTNKIDNIELIQQTIKNAIGDRRFYMCNQCGFKARQFHWQCPACNAWESLPSEPADIILEVK
jgi:lipopolysaccharide biosynthesis regulator YciM